MLVTVTLLLMSGQGLEAAAAPEPPKEPLVCRFERPAGLFGSRRKMCLTPSEWEAWDRRSEEASRKSIYELMGNTACLNGGLCTSD